MEIIKESQLEYIGHQFIGRCKACGCEFKTTIEIAAFLNGGGRRYRTTDHLENFHVRDNSSGDVYFTCNCPECGYAHAELRKEE